MDKCTFVQHNPVILLFLGTSELEVTMPELGEFIFNDFVPRKEKKKKKKKESNEACCGFTTTVSMHRNSCM